MKLHHARQIIFTMLFAALLNFFATGRANADDYNDCMTGELGRRVAACSAVIADPTITPFDLERALEIRSTDFLAAKKYAEAMQDLNKALELNPKSSASLNGRAWTIYRWKNTSDGMEDVDRSLQLDGSYAPAWDTRAHLYQLRGQFDKAFNDYEAAIGFGREYMIRSYQCGLRERGLYKGPVDGIYSATMRAALRSCAFSATCDPLPENEFQQECESATS